MVEVSGISLVLFLIARLNPAFALSAPCTALSGRDHGVDSRLDARVSVFVALIAAAAVCRTRPGLAANAQHRILSLFLSPSDLSAQRESWPSADSGPPPSAMICAAASSAPPKSWSSGTAPWPCSDSMSLPWWQSDFCKSKPDRSQSCVRSRSVLDIRDFTRFAESRTPSEVVAFQTPCLPLAGRRRRPPWRHHQQVPKMASWPSSEPPSFRKPPFVRRPGRA